MQVKQLKKYIIEPTLKEIRLLRPRFEKIYSPEAVKLLLMTAAVESNMGRYIVQKNSKMAEGKKALGIFQTEPATIEFVYNRLKRCKNMIPKTATLTRLLECVLTDLATATWVSRFVYWYKTKDPIPNVNDNEALWKYYKKWYNSVKGDTTREEFFNACKRHKVL